MEGSSREIRTSILHRTQKVLKRLLPRRWLEGLRRGRSQRVSSPEAISSTGSTKGGSTGFQNRWRGKRSTSIPIFDPSASFSISLTGTPSSPLIFQTYLNRLRNLVW